MEQLDRSRQTIALLAAALAGFVDAVGFLSADGYFVSFMSGNTTRLAVDLAIDPHGALIPALIIIGFVAGVAGGALLAEASGGWRKPAVLGSSGALLLVAAQLRWEGLTTASLLPMVLAMGVLNNTFRRDGEVAVGLTYMTGALVRLGQALGARLAGKPLAAGWGASLALWSSLALGGVAGAILSVSYLENPLWLAAALALALAAFAAHIVRQGRVSDRS